MLIGQNKSLFIYSVTRDLGFAPNPFHGFCTLATCKPDVRKKAMVGDWVMGIGGSTMKHQKRKCIFLMEVSNKMTFDEYWNNPEYQLKKAVRNGSKVQVLGDNIYHTSENGEWHQEDSHHSNADGTINKANLNRDTGKTNSVLISDNFFYFGLNAAAIDLDVIGHGRNVRNYQGYSLSNTKPVFKEISEFIKKHANDKNILQGDPVDFHLFDKRVDQVTRQYS
ncbi:hypothetical protein V6255_05910 [Psychromonas arctica]|uniref:Nucleotide modification associated domain-containing protein n=1 Tax=Psychromonas arctica TaxID=168275 RepID=A0ABU9HAB6_9GAMM